MNGVGSRDNQHFGAQSRCPLTRCLRFAGWVAPPRKTRLRMAGEPCPGGSDYPLGPTERFRLFHPPFPERTQFELSKWAKLHCRNQRRADSARRRGIHMGAFESSIPNRRNCPCASSGEGKSVQEIEEMIRATACEWPDHDLKLMKWPRNEYVSGGLNSG